MITMTQHQHRLLIALVSCGYLYAMSFTASTIDVKEKELASSAAMALRHAVQAHYAEVTIAPEADLETDREAGRKTETLSEVIGQIEEKIEEKGIKEKKPKFVRGKAAEEIYHPVIMEAANQHNIDPALIKAIIWAESSFNPSAVSNKGALGLMQLMPSTARSLGIKNPLDPESNIDAGVRYFKQLMVTFNGDAKLALAAYNAGSPRVLQYNGVPPFEATQYYIKKVFRLYEGYKKSDSIGQENKKPETGELNPV